MIAKFKIESKSNIHSELASMLLHMTNQFHIYHFQTKKYSLHKALSELYENLFNKSDVLIETIQGKTMSVLKGYKCYSYLEDNKPVDYAKSCIEYLENYRKECKKDSYYDNIDNQIQTIIDDLEKFLYLSSLE